MSYAKLQVQLGQAPAAADQPAVIVGEARFLQDTTTYVRTGDAFAYASVVVTVALLIVTRRRVR